MTKAGWLAAAMLAAGMCSAAAAATPKRPPSVLDLSTAPGAAGREQYAEMAIATFGPVIAQAPVCGIRSHHWGSSLEMYIGLVLDSPRPGIKEGNARPSQYETWLHELRIFEAKADLAVTADPKGTCARIRRNPNLAVGDWLAARERAIENSKDPWAAAGGK